MTITKKDVEECIKYAQKHRQEIINLIYEGEMKNGRFKYKVNDEKRRELVSEKDAYGDMINYLESHLLSKTIPKQKLKV